LPPVAPIPTGKPPIDLSHNDTLGLGPDPVTPSTMPPISPTTGIPPIGQPTNQTMTTSAQTTGGLPVPTALPPAQSNGGEKNLCQNKNCGEVCDNTQEMIPVIRHCQPDGSCQAPIPSCPVTNCVTVGNKTACPLPLPPATGNDSTTIGNGSVENGNSSLPTGTNSYGSNSYGSNSYGSYSLINGGNSTGNNLGNSANPSSGPLPTNSTTGLNSSSAVLPGILPGILPVVTSTSQPVDSIYKTPGYQVSNKSSDSVQAVIPGVSQQLHQLLYYRDGQWTNKSSSNGGDEASKQDQHPFTPTPFSAYNVCHDPPMSVGICHHLKNVSAWSWDPSDHLCHNFGYSGCGPSRNIFWKEADCYAYCRAAQIP